MKTIVAVIGLCLYFKVWRFWELQRRISRTITERRELGIIAPKQRLVVKDMLGYGRWVAQMRFVNWLMKGE